MKIEEQIHNTLSDSNVSWGETKQVLESIVEDVAIRFCLWLSTLDNGTKRYNTITKEELESKGYSPYELFVADTSPKELFELFKKENNL